MTSGVMDLGELVRIHALRAPRLMWLLGAGVSASAGIPTAGQLVDEFKQLIYCSEAGVARQLVDLSEPATAHKVQAYLDADQRFPPAGSTAEYSVYFEAAMADPRDRRAFLESRVVGRQPTYGHFALAVLMAMHKCRLVWTTNFDPLIEDAVAQVTESTSTLTTVEPETSARIAALQQERWPIQVKLHGDFRSDLLKNTEDELQQQEAGLRASLVAECVRGGLVVLGYSGRDASVMEALGDAVAHPEAFPQGLYWCHFGASPPLPDVLGLLREASDRGISAHLVPSGTADEVLGRIVDVVDVPSELRPQLDKRQPPRRCSPMRLPPLEGSWPRIELNALRVVSFPHTCRLVACEIGGTREVRQAVEDAGVAAVVARRSDGVIGFGGDEDFRRAFDPFEIKAFDIAQLDTNRLWRERSADLGLLYDAITRSLTQDGRLVPSRLRGSHLLVMSDEGSRDAGTEQLRKVAGHLSGHHRSGFRWAEAVRLRLEQRLGVLWLVFEPTVWGERCDSPEDAAMRSEFLRERHATRYNRAWDQLLRGWSEVLTNGHDERTVEAFAFDGRPGINASFTIASTLATSRQRRSRRR